MHYLSFVQFALLLAAPGARAQDTTSSTKTTSTTGSQLILSGSATGSALHISEPRTPTGSYITYSSTETLETTISIPFTTEAVVSTVTKGSSTYETTIGSTTLFAVETEVASNLTATVTSTSTTSSKILLQGSSTATAANGTANSTSTATSSPIPTNTTPCNMYPAFCNRKYSNITEVSAHNSPFDVPNNAASNQAYPVTQQLDDGIRLLQGQMHFVNNTPHFCHTSCEILDAGPITEYLGSVYKWVSTHPYDVVTILLENGDYAPVTQYVPFLESTGLVQYAYVPPKIPMAKEDWPTLGNMILTSKRVVFFMDYEANQTAVPWILDEFSHVWETPFDPTDRNFPCDVQRPPGLSTQDAAQRMYLTNHNLNYDIQLLGASLLVPVIPLLNVTNNFTGFGSLGVATNTCNNTYGVPPRFLNVDYYNVGNGSVFEIAANWSGGVVYNRTCCGVTTSAGFRVKEASLGRLCASVAGLALLLMMI